MGIQMMFWDTYLLAILCFFPRQVLPYERYLCCGAQKSAPWPRNLGTAVHSFFHRFCKHHQILLPKFLQVFVSFVFSPFVLLMLKKALTPNQRRHCETLLPCKTWKRKRTRLGSTDTQRGWRKQIHQLNLGPGDPGKTQEFCKTLVSQC